MLLPTATCIRHIGLIVVLVLALAACGKDSSTKPTTPQPPSPPAPPTLVPTRIEVAPETVTLAAIGQTVKLSATVRDQNGAAITGAAVTWSSGNSGVATVSQTGLVTAVDNGNTQVTARSGNLNARVTVTVSQTVTQIVINPGAARVQAIGDTLQLTVTGLDSRAKAVEGAVLDVTWSSSDEGIATVTSEGLVTTTGNGMAQITARSGSMNATADITVLQSVWRIAISPMDAALTGFDDTVKFMAEAVDFNGHAVEGVELSWKSSNESVATVSSDGLVTAMGNGTAEISAHWNDETAVATVTVTGASPDRAVLVSFFEATGGPHWTRNTNWLSDRPFDEWYGVSTDDHERVTRLELFDNNLTGTLTPELVELTKLNYLRLSGNKLTGPIPGELGLLPELLGITLTSNRLSGEIPWELGRSPSLFTLQLNYNQLTGEIPVELGQLTGLHALQLNDNLLTGEIPSELGQLTQLSTLFLNYNMLSGPIPPALGDLAKVERLELNNNRLTGEIPPELGKMTSLREIFLDRNMLSGPLPKELGGLPQLNLVFVQLNRDLAGPLPRSFLDLDLEYLRLEGTQLCVPADDAFMTWLEDIRDRGALYCQPDIQGQ